jgi:dTDP-4-amino-4,6-dideoxygalactose transaminase
MPKRVSEYHVHAIFADSIAITKRGQSVNSKSRQVGLNRPSIGLAERAAVNRVLRSGNLAQGVTVAEFESAYSSYVSGAMCVALNSGTSALHLALLALDIGPGDEVIVPTFTFAATANAAAITGAKPVFVDIEGDYFGIHPDRVVDAITSRTKAVIAVHLYGHPAEMAKLKQICLKHGLFLVEDAAQAHLAEYQGRPVGSIGDVGAFSFYPTKNMTTGEGGMATTFNPETARRIRLLRNQGMEIRYQNEIPGFNNRMTEVAAAIGLVQLGRIRAWTRKRQANAKFLDDNLVGVKTPKVAPNATHVYHQYTLQLVDHDRDSFAKELKNLGVDSDVYYPAPVHTLPAYRLALDTPVAESVSKTCLSIPVHQNLKSADLHRIVFAINKLAEAGS